MEQEGRTLFCVKSMHTTSQIWSSKTPAFRSVLEIINAANRNEDLARTIFRTPTPHKIAQSEPQARLRTKNHRPGYRTPLPLHPKMKKITHITRNMKNKTFAIPAEAAAIPPNPSTAATSAIIKNVTAQPNIVSPPFTDWIALACTCACP